MSTIAKRDIPEVILYEINRLSQEHQMLKENINSKQLHNDSLLSANNNLYKIIRDLLSEENKKQVDLVEELLVAEGYNLRISVQDLKEIVEEQLQKQREDDQLLRKKLQELENTVQQKTEQTKSMQASITSKQQSINRLTSDNRKQMDKIDSLSIVSTSNKKIENELKSTKIQLNDSTEQNKLLKQKMENQRTELKNLNTKSTQISMLNAEIAKLKLQLEEKKRAIRDRDNELYTCNKKINDLEQQIMRYDEIMDDLDDQREMKLPVAEDSNRECTICCEVFTEDRKKVAYGPCGHNIACIECSEAILRKTMATAVRGQKKVCPICRADIKTTLVLEGIY